MAAAVRQQQDQVDQLFQVRYVCTGCPEETRDKTTQIQQRVLEQKLERQGDGIRFKWGVTNEGVCRHDIGGCYIQHDNQIDELDDIPNANRATLGNVLLCICKIVGVILASLVAVAIAAILIVGLPGVLLYLGVFISEFFFIAFCFYVAIALAAQPISTVVLLAVCAFPFFVVGALLGISKTETMNDGRRREILDFSLFQCRSPMNDF